MLTYGYEDYDFDYDYEDMAKEAEVRGVLAAFCDSGFLKVASAEHFDDLTEKVAYVLDDFYTVDDIADATDYVIKEAATDWANVAMNNIKAAQGLPVSAQPNSPDPEPKVYKQKSRAQQFKQKSRAKNSNSNIEFKQYAASPKNTFSAKNNTKWQYGAKGTGKLLPAAFDENFRRTGGGQGGKEAWHKKALNAWKSWAMPGWQKGSRLKSLGKGAVAWGVPAGVVAAGSYGAHKALSD